MAVGLGRPLGRIVGGGSVALEARRLSFPARARQL